MFRLPLLTCTFTVALSSLCLTNPIAGQVFAAGLQPHRAVYDLTLHRADEEAGISEVTGRMVYEFEGSACEGYTVNYRFVSRMVSSEGASVVSDFRVTSFEEGDGSAFHFATNSFINNRPEDSVRGMAERVADDIQIDLTEPDDTTVSLSGEAVFPSQQFIDILAQAAAGKRVAQHVIYDASDDGQTLYDSTSLIGQETRLSDASGDVLATPEIKDTPYWPITVSYFKRGGTGEVLPDYVTSFLLHENGISRNIILDYGNMALKGTLQEIDILPLASCE